MFHVCLYVCAYVVSGHTCATVSMRRSEENFVESVIYFHLSGYFEDHIQEGMFGLPSEPSHQHSSVLF